MIRRHLQSRIGGHKKRRAEDDDLVNNFFWCTHLTDFTATDKPTTSLCFLSFLFFFCVLFSSSKGKTVTDLQPSRPT